MVFQIRKVFSQLISFLFVCLFFLPNGFCLGPQTILIIVFITLLLNLEPIIRISTNIKTLCLNGYGSISASLSQGCELLTVCLGHLTSFNLPFCFLSFLSASSSSFSFHLCWLPRISLLVGKGFIPF